MKFSFCPCTLATAARWRRVFAAAGLTVLALVIVSMAAVGWRAATVASRQLAPATARPGPYDASLLAQRLAEAVRLPTVSFDDRPDASAPAMLRLHEQLAQAWPHAHRAMTRETVNGLSLLYTWRGRDAAAPPIILMAHLDVVPVDPATLARWTHPPFDGVVADDHVWGRGAWDNKSNLCMLLAAIDSLAAEGFVPRQTVYVVAGHDEEMGSGAGLRGAGAVAALLSARGVHAAFVLDEGLLVTHRVMRGIDAPVALVGVAEKGYLTLEVSARGVAGHSSMPGPRSAVATLARAVTAIDDAQPRASLDDVARGMLQTLAPEFGGLNRVALTNLWLFEPLVRRQLEATSTGTAMLRTTQAPTVLRAGDKDTATPALARLHLNLRLRPGDALDAAARRIEAATAGLDVEVRPLLPAWPASPVASTDHAGYRRIAGAIRAAFPGAVVGPGLMVGATDSRHFVGLADQFYRFSPIEATPQDLPRFHGIDERIAVSNLVAMVTFYRTLLIDNGAHPPDTPR